MKTQILRLLLLLTLMLLQACIPQRSIDGPMNRIEDNIKCSIRPLTLIVMLPGVYDKPKDFVDYGFIEAVRARNIDADIQLVDAHIGYYTSQEIVNRLQEEVFAPAKVKGYKQIWFAGISLGGYGAMLFNANYPNMLEGMLLMSPYMGSRDIPAEIQKLGGLKKWIHSGEISTVDINLWKSLQAYINQSSELSKAYIGFGSSDRFAKINTLFSDVLPKSNSFELAGGHDWITWLKLWDKFLDSAPLPRIDRRATNCAAI